MAETQTDEGAPAGANGTAHERAVQMVPTLTIDEFVARADQAGAELVRRFRDAETRDDREQARKQLRSLLGMLASLPTQEEARRKAKERAAAAAAEDRALGPLMGVPMQLDGFDRERDEDVNL